jgi:hypothetical protein
MHRENTSPCAPLACACGLLPRTLRNGSRASTVHLFTSGKNTLCHMHSELLAHALCGGMCAGAAMQSAAAPPSTSASGCSSSVRASLGAFRFKSFAACCGGKAPSACNRPSRSLATRRDLCGGSTRRPFVRVAFGSRLMLATEPTGVRLPVLVASVGVAHAQRSGTTCIYWRKPAAQSIA